MVFTLKITLGIPSLYWQKLAYVYTVYIFHPAWLLLKADKHELIFLSTDLNFTENNKYPKHVLRLNYHTYNTSCD